MADPKPAKKTDAPEAKPAPQPAAKPAQPETKAARPTETAEKRAPQEAHERFWQAGQALHQDLQKSQEEVQNRFASAYRDQQQNLWKAHIEAQKRADELRLDYWSALNRATGEDSRKVCQEAAQKYNDALLEIQLGLRKEWETAGANYQKAMATLQEATEATRITAFNAYKNACRRAWSELDPNSLTCESLASIGQSLLMGAAAVGGRPHAGA